MTRQSLLLLFSVVSLTISAQNKPQLSPATIKQVIAAMTLEEKVSLVVGTNKKISDGPVIGNSEGRIKGAAGYTNGIIDYGISGTVLADGPAGVRIDPTRKNDTRTYYATAWPVGIALASSWNTDLVRKVGVAFGAEVKEYGVDVILAPGMNIQRDPLNGRNFEYYSEDPHVTGHIGAAMVNGIQSNGVGTSIKHFAANNQETNRNKVSATVSERALREIYLRGFEIAVKKAQPWTIMSSYNKINNTYASESHDLLTKILRNEWGYNGYVMTDWFGGRDRVAQMIAGNDLIMPGGESYANALLDGVKSGVLSEKVLDENIERILKIVVQSPSYKAYKYSDSPDLKGHAVIAREAASECMVLLKNNDKTLPINQSAKIALFGNASYETIIGGDGSGDVNEAYSIPMYIGLTKAGFSINEELTEKQQKHIRDYYSLHPKKTVLTLGKPVLIPEYLPEKESIEKLAVQSDIAILSVGRKSGEGGDRNVMDDFNLSELEKTLIKNVSEVFHAKGKKVIVLLNIGGVIETASWKDNADAILLTWLPGQEAGNAIADVLSGKVNPSGKLATTFPINYSNLPSAKNFPGTPSDKPTEVVYEEGIYVGYRYFNSFSVKTSYPFGYGLTYSAFSYSNLKLSSGKFKGELLATVTITNTGKVAGKEIVQLYLSAPATGLDKPNEELKGFVKTKLLNPGESQTVTFALNPKDLASFNTDQSAWIAEAGNYIVKIGVSCEDIKLTKSFRLQKELMVEKTTKSLAPQVQINELRNLSVQK